MLTELITLLTSVIDYKSICMKKLFLLLLPVFVFTSCLHDDFDEPPVGGGNGEAPEPNATIADLKTYHQSGELVKILDNVVVKGVVIADDRSGNYYKTIVFQDASAGIDLKINSTGLFADFPIGQEIIVSCKDLYITDFNNLIQLGSVYDDNGTLRLGGIEEVLINKHIFKGQSNLSPVVQTKSINELTLDDVSTLVQIENVQFTSDDSGKTFADVDTRFSLNRELEDCDENTILLRTSGYADFAGDLTPTGNGSITAVFSVYQSTQQLWIRDLNDIDLNGKRCNEGGGGGGGTSTPVNGLDEGFEAMGNDDDIDLNGWSNVAVKGTRLWRAKEFDGNVYAQATAFNDNSPEMESWLITPPINFDVATKLEFQSAKAFYNHEGLSVFISTDYDESNPNDATWQELSCRLASEADPDHDWIDSGQIDLSGYDGIAYIGFKYTGSAPSGTSSYRIDNVKVY